MMKLSLGSVQLGVAYGVNNAVGALSDTEADAVLEAAVLSGFTMVDTSTDYGSALPRIGRFLRKHPGALEVVAKFHAAETPDVIRGLKGYCRDALGRAADYTLLWTSGQDIAALDPGLADGVTVYDVAEAEAVGPGFEMVQVPASCLDGRMDAEIPALQAQGKTVLVRSLLLQGLLAADPATGPAGHYNCPELASLARPYLHGLRGIAADAGLSVPEIAVRWAWQLDCDVAIVGAETVEQVVEIGAAWHKGPLPATVVYEVLALRESVPKVVISPREWAQEFAFTLGRPDAG